MSDYRHILAAIDFSDATAPVCERAADLARRYQSPLTLVHVVEPMVVDPIYDVLPAIPPELQSKQLELAGKRLREVGLKFGIGEDQCRLETGATRTEILRVAAEVRADLLVLGSHGRSGVGRLLGSTTSAVMHAALCDVLAVRIDAGK